MCPVFIINKSFQRQRERKCERKSVRGRGREIEKTKRKRAGETNKQCLSNVVPVYFSAAPLERRSASQTSSNDWRTISDKNRESKTKKSGQERLGFHFPRVHSPIIADLSVSELFPCDNGPMLGFIRWITRQRK